MVLHYPFRYRCGGPLRWRWQSLHLQRLRFWNWNKTGSGEFHYNRSGMNQQMEKMRIRGGQSECWLIGVSNRKHQVLDGRDFDVRRFGYSISGGLDIDNNHYPDVAVGSLNDSVVLFRWQKCNVYFLIFLNRNEVITDATWLSTFPQGLTQSSMCSEKYLLTLSSLIWNSTTAKAEKASGKNWSFDKNSCYCFFQLIFNSI